jgi:hypothetical protein
MLMAAAASSGAGVPADAPLPEANAFVHGLAERQRRHEDSLNDFSYDMREVEETLDKKGAVTKSRTRDFEVFHVQGAPVRRQVAENGVPFTPERQAREDGEVEKRIREARKRNSPTRKGGALSEVLARYTFRSVAREDVDGRPAVVMDFTPRSGKRDLEGDWVLRSLAGRIWVDEQEREIVRAELHNTSKMKAYLGLASVSQFGFAARFRKVQDGVWLPLRLESHVTGRLALFKVIRARTTQTYSGYRRFQVDAEEKVRLPGEPDR